MRTRLLHFFFFLFVLGCGSDPPPPVASFGSGDLRWQSFPIPIQVDASFLDGGSAEEDLGAALRFWEERAGKSLFLLRGGWDPNVAPFNGPAENPREILANVILFQSPWPFEANIAGKTILHSTGGAIQRTLVLLSEDVVLCGGNCGGGPNVTSRRKLLAHELGHVLGLAHGPDREDLMYPEILPGRRLEEMRVDGNLLGRLTR